MIALTPRRGMALLAVATVSVVATSGLVATAAHAEAVEQINNGSFNDSSNGWFAYGTTSSAVTDGRYCSVVPGGLANVWDAGVGQNGLRLTSGAEYTLAFSASTAPAATVRASVQLGSEPYTAYLSKSMPLSADMQRLTYTFTAPETTDKAQVAFQLGGNATEYTFCLDDVSLIGGEPAPPYVPETGPRVRVNQVGYLPDGPKKATVVTTATTPLPWQLKDSSGAVVASGNTTPRGVDAASGQNVQTLDFTTYTKPGTGYTITADGETSFPFEVSASVYQQLRSDALQFFYIQRSGIAIDGSLVGQEYARPAGHLGVAPNQGDTDVPCQAGVCDYRLDVRGGWYDAGDHGKYVVNGGLATYQLLSTFERGKTAPTARGGKAMGDSTLRVPERGNKIPDILDEARWELDFMMRMQVPAGKPLAGMAHHKMHDANWTGLPLAPQDDPQVRELHPPSTAATLNLAATAAQCARLFAPYDATYAATCLTSARTAYEAAVANPAILASDSDGTGGGTYSDRDVSDEFYWAAAELYLTTGEQRYLTDLTASPHHTGEVFPATGFSWPSTAALGRLDLATVPNALPAAERTRIRESVTAAADTLVGNVASEAYGLPSAASNRPYYWGSNGNILNNMVVIATAYDLTGKDTYRSAAIESIDYILGRNALNQSYVTGWGEKNSHNQHSRIFGNQANPAFPIPPAGSLAGGANVSLDDPFAAKLLAGCVGQFCYVDDIESYATNEVAINWNSALTWASAFLADQGTAAPAQGTCQVRYERTEKPGGGFSTSVTITNTGRRSITGWSLAFAFTGDQKVTRSRKAKVSQAGATVTARNESGNRSIAPGRSVTFGFTGTSSGANPAPEQFLLNGAVCAR